VTGDSIADQPAFRLVGRAARVPLIHYGPNPHIEAHVSSLPPRLKALSNTEPAGMLQVSADVDPDYAEGAELTYLHARRRHRRNAGAQRIST